MIDNNRKKVIHDPVLFEMLSKQDSFGNSSLSDTGSSVCQITHEDALKLLTVDFLPEDDSKVTNEFKHCHSNSPLAIFRHIRKCRQQWWTQKVLSDDISNLYEALDHIESDFWVFFL